MSTVGVRSQLGIIDRIWGDDTDYDSRAMFIINRMEQRIRERNLKDPTKFRRVAVGKMVDIIAAEDTKEASRREIEALRKHYSRIYPYLKDVIIVPGTQ